MEYVYHGSAVPGIAALEARSTLHGTDRRVVYLTDSVPYTGRDPAQQAFMRRYFTQAWARAEARRSAAE